MKCVVIFADAHINSTVGLCPAIVELDDGGTYKRSISQRELWVNWLTFTARVEELSKQYEIITISNGDLAETDAKRRSLQLINNNPATIKEMVVETINPLLKVTKKFFVIKGTAAHGGKSGSMEEMVGKDISSAKTSTGKYSWWWLPLQVEGVTFDISHHTTMGMSDITRPNSAPKLAANTVMRYAKEGTKPPNFVIRSHVHRWGDSNDEFPTRALITPCWSLATEYVHQVSSGARGEVGGIIIHCDSGKSEVEKIYFKERRPTWVIA